MIGIIFYTMNNNHVFPDSSLRPGLVDKRHSIYPVVLAFHKKTLMDYHFIDLIKGSLVANFRYTNFWVAGQE